MKNIADAIFFTRQFVSQAPQICLDRRSESEIQLAIPSTKKASAEWRYYAREEKRLAANPAWLCRQLP